MGRVFVASDRGPLTVGPGGAVVTRPGSVTGILDAAARGSAHEVTWVALSTAADDAAAAARGRFAAPHRDLGYRYEPVVVDPARYRRYYHDAGVGLLWYAHHDLWSEIGAAARPDAVGAFGDYAAVNDRVAARLVACSDAHDPVVAHDYQLALVAAGVRRRRPSQPVACFTHTPFASPTALAMLPREVGVRLVEGMLQADLLGFQRGQWAEGFLDCCRAIGARVEAGAERVRHAGRETVVRHYPVPIDVPAVASRAAEPAARAWRRRLAAFVGRRRCVVRVERLDPAKNAVRGLEAFSWLLEQPLHGADVCMVACFVPSREEVPEYRTYRERVRRAALAIERRRPGRLAVYWGHDMARATAALQVADVLLVNSLRDGMNLVALEGAVLGERDSVVVLSRQAGAADVLAGCALLLDDPADVPATGRRVAAALAMDTGERARRARVARARLAASPEPAAWLGRQVDDLLAVARGRS